MSRFNVVLGGLVAFTLALATPFPAAAAGTSAGVVREAQVSPTPTSLAGAAWEPIVSAHPTNPNYLAVAYPTGSSSVSGIVRISHDGGKTWHSTSTRPFHGGIHPAVAWGPGPTAGSARLYYANMIGGSGGLYSATSYSDNEGHTWSSPRVSHTTTPWVGGFQDITTDNNPASPNYGMVYVAYNWPASRTHGPGLHILASADYGRTWKGTEIAIAPRPAGYSDTWRIDYRLRTAPDGSVYVAFYQLDMHYWNFNDIFNKGGASNVGRIGFSVARFEFNRASKTFTHHPTVSAAKIPETSWNLSSYPGGTSGGLRTDPQWSIGLDVDPLTGRVYMAVEDSGGIRIYRSDDQGKTWSYKTLPTPTKVNGRSQWSAKPNLVVGAGFVMVTLHTIDRAAGAASTVGAAYAISYNGGDSWSRPTPISGSRWRSANLATALNGSGLRDRAAVTADHSHVFFVYGDGRLAAGAKEGRSAIFGALIGVSIP